MFRDTGSVKNDMFFMLQYLYRGKCRVFVYN